MKYLYGTSGFRFNHETMFNLSPMIGCAICILSERKKKYLGIMITASHNDHSYNGIKIIDSTGELLSQDEEIEFSSLVNSNQQFQSESRNSKILVATDTRPSGQTIKKLIFDSINKIDKNPTIRDLGLLTTPQMHYEVYKQNNQHPKGYLDYFIPKIDFIIPELILDCSNGVGYISMNKIIQNLSIKNITLVNTNISDSYLINKNCGSDYICSQKKLPYNNTQIDIKNKLLASFDGDVDRIVFYFYQNCQLKLLDGDKIISLIALYIKQINEDNNLTIGIIHTAYSNRNFIKFINSLGFDCHCVPTGVKHLHRRAKQFDIGIYFEANGHGTVLFNKDSIKNNSKLLRLSSMFNQLIGDAITDLFSILYILSELKITINEWYNLYYNNPNKLGKIYVKDRSQFISSSDESYLIKPANIQTSINKLSSEYTDTFIFIRPSGTEDCLRYYIETKSVPDLNILEKNLLKILENYT